MGRVGRFSPFQDPSTRVGEVAAAIAAVFILLAAYLVVSSGAASDAALRLTDGSVWLRSSQAGITLHDSGNGAVITALQTATGDDDFDVVQWQSDALVVNSTTSTIARVDGTSWQIADALPIPGSEEIKVFVGPAAAWRTSLGRIAEIDPIDLRASTVEVPFASRVFDGVVDAAGDLFISTDNDGIQLFRSGATEPESVFDSDGVSDMFQVGGKAAAVNQADRSIWMAGEGIVCDALEVPSDTALHAEGSDELAVTVADTGFINIFDPTDGCPTNPTSVSSGSFGQPVLSDSWGVVPEYEQSIIYLIDLDERSVSQTAVQLDLEPGTEFELISENGLVWFNDPNSPDAGLIREDGTVTPISKYDANNIDASFTVPQIDGDALDEVLIQSLQLDESASEDAEADLSSLSEADDPDAAVEDESTTTTTPEDNTDESSEPSFAADTTTPETTDDASADDQSTEEEPAPIEDDAEEPAPDDGTTEDGTTDDGTDDQPPVLEDPDTDNESPDTTEPGDTDTSEPGPDPDDGTTPDDETDPPEEPPTTEAEEPEPGEISVQISGVSNPVVGDEVTFRAVVSGGDADTITWSFSPDNTTGFGEGQEISTTFSDSGSVTITVTACTAEGQCDTSRSRLNVVEPEVEIPLEAKINPPATATVGEPVSFRDVSTGEPDSRAWFFQDGDPRTSSAANPSVTFGSAGLKTVTLTVERDGETDIVEVTIEVTDEPDPINMTLSCGQATADVGTTFTCSINDAALDAASDLSFTVSGAGTEVSESTANGRVTVEATGDGTITITATATINGETQTARDTVTGVETAPEPPVASITGATSADEGESVTLRVNNSGGPIDGYSWAASGATPSSGSSATFSPSWSDAGTYTVRLTVTQNGESYDGGTHTVTVNEVVPPEELEERINDRRLTSDNDNWPRRSIAMFGGARAELESVVAGSADGFDPNGISFAYSRNGDSAEAFHEFTFIEYDNNGTALGRTRFRFFVSPPHDGEILCPAVVFEFTGGPRAATNDSLKRANVSWSTSQPGISSYWVTSANGQETPVRTDSGNPQSNGSVVIGQSIYTGNFVPASGVIYTTHIRVESACDGSTIESSVSWSVTYEDDDPPDPDPADIKPVTNVACSYRDVQYVGTTLTWTEHWTWTDVSTGEVGHRLPYSGGANEAAANQQQSFVSGITGGTNGSGGVTSIITLAPVGSTDASVSVSCQGSGGSWNPPPPPVDDPDTDGDGVTDSNDDCVNEPGPASNNGCPEPEPPVDSDGDGVNDDLDACPGTPAGTPVDATGCAIPPADSDGDGVTDDLDACPGTPAGTPVGTNGCELPPDPDPDTDGDGVEDAVDDCINESGPASNNGCPLPPDPPADSDGDGVNDDVDACPGTPAGTPVDATGCPLPPEGGDDDPADGGAGGGGAGEGEAAPDPNGDGAAAGGEI